MLTAKSAKDFAAARSRVFFEWLYNLITRRPNALLSFDDVKASLSLHTSLDRGLQDIELNNIVGSVGKYRQFTRSFLPKEERLEDRWRQVDEIFYEQGFPPIDVNKVGNVYFVNDGHHRVSVNRTHHVPTIEAYVKEYPTSVPINRMDSLADIRRKVHKQVSRSGEPCHSAAA